MAKTPLISALLFFSLLHTVSAVLCQSCEDIFFDATNTSLIDNPLFCSNVDISTSLCKSELFVDLIEPYSAAIRYLTVPPNALVATNGERELVTTIYIPLDVGFPYASVVHNCYDHDLCNNGTLMEERYDQLRALNFSYLHGQLGELLYEGEGELERKGIECYSGSTKTVHCSTGWLCQATLGIERGRADTLSATCVPNRRPGARAGLIVQSKLVGEDYKRTSFSYTCNRDKCNDASTVAAVRQVLLHADLVDSKARSSTLVSTALLLLCTILTVSRR